MTIKSYSNSLYDINHIASNIKAKIRNGISYIYQHIINSSTNPCLISLNCGHGPG